MANNTNLDMKQICGDDTMFGIVLGCSYVLLDEVSFKNLDSMNSVQAFLFGVEQALGKTLPLVVKNVEAMTPTQAFLFGQSLAESHSKTVETKDAEQTFEKPDDAA